MVVNDSGRGSVVNVSLAKKLPDSTGFEALDAAIANVKRLIEAQRLVGVRIDTLNEQKQGAANADRRKHAEALHAGKKPPAKKESNVAKVEEEIVAAQAEFEAFTDAIRIADRELDTVLAANAEVWIAECEAEVANAWSGYLNQLQKLRTEVAAVGEKRGLVHFLKQARGGRFKTFQAPQVVHTLSDADRVTTWDQLFARLEAEATHQAPALPELTGPIKLEQATKGGLKAVPVEQDATHAGRRALYTAGER